MVNDMPNNYSLVIAALVMPGLTRQSIIQKCFDED
jgi:hypothetical protein